MRAADGKSAEPCSRCYPPPVVRWRLGLAAISVVMAAIAACVGEDPEPARDTVIIIAPEAGGSTTTSSGNATSSSSSSSGGSSSSSSSAGGIDGGDASTIACPTMACTIGTVCCDPLLVIGECMLPSDCLPSAGHVSMACDSRDDCAVGQFCCAVEGDAGYSATCQSHCSIATFCVTNRDCPDAGPCTTSPGEPPFPLGYGICH